MKWWFANIAGIGECLFETDSDLANEFDTGEFIEAHRITMLVVNPNNGQIGYMRNMACNPNLANGGVQLRKAAITLFAEARSNAVADMDRVWSENPKGGIALPTQEDVLKFRKP